jgi:hypothetical protein
MPAAEADEPVETPFEDIVVGVELRPAREERETPPPAAGYSWWQWPLVAVNALFDALTLPLGPLGAGLRSRVGRSLLAAAGVVCLAAAVVLVVADGIGWIW